jgi:hypothetical protein
MLESVDANKREGRFGPLGPCLRVVRPVKIQVKHTNLNFLPWGNATISYTAIRNRPYYNLYFSSIQTLTEEHRGLSIGPGILGKPATDVLALESQWSSIGVVILKLIALHSFFHTSRARSHKDPLKHRPSSNIIFFLSADQPDGDVCAWQTLLRATGL